MRQAMAVLERLEVACDYYPAGAVFYRRYLADPVLMEEAAVWRGAETVFDTGFWSQGSRLIHRLATGEFFKPYALLESLDWIDKALGALVAGTSCRLGRRTFSAARLKDNKELLNFVTDAAENPFYHFSHLCAQWVKLEHEGVIFIAETPGQAVAAATFALLWHRRWPSVPMGIVGKHQAARKVAELIDNYGKRRPLSRLISQIEVGIDSAVPVDIDYSPLAPPCPTGKGALSVEVDLDHINPESAIDASGARLLVCKGTGRDPARTAAFLHGSARRGFWNHLVIDNRVKGTAGLMKFSAFNPNLVHSWCRIQMPDSIFSDPRPEYPCGRTRYGETIHRPGRLFWQVVRDPEYLAIFLTRLDPFTLRRMLVDPAGKDLKLLGERLQYHFCQPRQLAPGVLDEICRMVSAGGTVGMRWVRHNLENAFLVAYVEEDGEIIANSSLKHPRRQYVEAVSRQAGIDLNGFLERGYTSVKPEYRGLGIGARLLEGLTSRASRWRIFSVIAEDNEATKKIALRNKTRKVAVFFSRRAGKQVGVWIPEWMLPPGTQVLE